MAADCARAKHVGHRTALERLDRPGERYENKIGDDLTGGKFYDLAKADIKPRARGGVLPSEGGRSTSTPEL